MKLKFRKDKNGPTDSATAGNMIGRQLDKSYYFIREKWAKWMSRKTAHWPRNRLVLVWMLFFLAAGSYSGFLIIASFSADSAVNIRPASIIQPKDVGKSDGKLRSNISLSETEFSRITSFRLYMDSLGRSPTGRATYDSIIRRRPGLLDSLSTVENYYYINSKYLNHGK